MRVNQRVRRARAGPALRLAVPEEDIMPGTFLLCGGAGAVHRAKLEGLCGMHVHLFLASTHIYVELQRCSCCNQCQQRLRSKTRPQLFFLFLFFIELRCVGLRCMSQSIELEYRGLSCTLLRR